MFVNELLRILNWNILLLAKWQSLFKFYRAINFTGNMDVTKLCDFNTNHLRSYYRCNHLVSSFWYLDISVALLDFKQKWIYKFFCKVPDFNHIWILSSLGRAGIFPRFKMDVTFHPIWMQEKSFQLILRINHIGLNEMFVYFCGLAIEITMHVIIHFPLCNTL
jgi:hypothetical protein